MKTVGERLARCREMAVALWPDDAPWIRVGLGHRGADPTVAFVISEREADAHLSLFEVVHHERALEGLEDGLRALLHGTRDAQLEELVASWGAEAEQQLGWDASYKRALRRCAFELGQLVKETR